MISTDILLLHSIKQIKRFHVAAGLCNDRSHKMSECGKNNSDTPGCALCAPCLFLPNFEVIYNLLLNRITETQSLLTTKGWPVRTSNLLSWSSSELIYQAAEGQKKFCISWISLRSLPPFPMVESCGESLMYIPHSLYVNLLTRRICLKIKGFKL